MTIARDDARMLWRSSDLRTAFLTGAVGFSALGAASWSAGGTAELDRQFAWIVVAILGLISIGVGNFLWLLSARRAVRVRTLQLVGALDVTAGVIMARSVDGEAQRDDGSRVTLSGSPRFHRQTCILVQGKRSHAIVDTGGWTPCEMCEP